jgi:peptidoglycan LD-endopeptidase LytH
MVIISTPDNPLPNFTLFCHMDTLLSKLIKAQQPHFYPVVAFAPGIHTVALLDSTESNSSLQQIDLTDTTAFSQYISQALQAKNATYLIGGYMENRILYKRSRHFDGAENRTIHLGIDIWGKAGTKVFAPMDASIHSFAYNNNFGDYGATIILQHQLEGEVFHTLYGHLSLSDIENLQPGQSIQRGETIAHFGQPHENGNWPPHLHFQIIKDMQNKNGDYPGVCTISDQEYYLSNCPDPNVILNMMKYAI